MMHANGIMISICVAGLVLLEGQMAGAAPKTREYSLRSSVIVVADDAESPVRRAAWKLQEYLGRRTGVAPAIVAPDQVVRLKNHLKINVGMNSKLKRTPDLSLCAYDGFYLKTLPGQNLLIAGRSAVGTEFGVYAFLEEYCGVRWFLPGPLGTFIPPESDLHIGDINRQDAPFFISRALYIGRTPEYDRQWMRHNRLLSRFPPTHNLGRIINASKYGKDHPEYFPLKDGQRHIPNHNRVIGFQPCMTNPDVVRLVAEAATKFFDENPDEIGYSLGINDNAKFWCECTDCVKANGGAPQPNSRGLADYSRVTFAFYNQVADLIPERHKDKYLSFLAYANVRDLPENMELRPNLMPIRTTAFICYFNPADKRDMAGTLAYGKNARTFGVYEYFYGGNYVVPVFPIGLLEGYIDALAANGARGWFAEATPNWTVDGIKYYLLAKKLWNPKLKTHALLREYCEKMFDQGANDMLEFYRICQTNWELQTVTNTSKYHLNGSPGQALVFPVADCERLLALLKNASAKTVHPAGRQLLDKMRGRYTLMRDAATGVALARDMAAAQGEPDKLADFCLAAMSNAVSIRRNEATIRADPLAAPRSSKARVGAPLIAADPETIAWPLRLACGRADHPAWRKFMNGVKQAQLGDELYRRLESLENLPAVLDAQPELLVNGDFCAGGAVALDAHALLVNAGLIAGEKTASAVPGWMPAEWGSLLVKSRIAVEGMGDTRSLVLNGLAGCFMYAPHPVATQDITLTPGKYYALRCDVSGDVPMGGAICAIHFKPISPGKKPPYSSAGGRVMPTQNQMSQLWLFQMPPGVRPDAGIRLEAPGVGISRFSRVSLKEIPESSMYGAR